MQLLSEFRYPTRWYSKLIVALLATFLLGKPAHLDSGGAH